MISRINRLIDTIWTILKSLVEVPRSHRAWREEHARQAAAALEAAPKPDLCSYNYTTRTMGCPIAAPTFTIAVEQDNRTLTYETPQDKPPTQPKLTAQQARRIELFGLLDQAEAEGLTKYEEQLKFIKDNSSDGKGTSKRTVAAWKQQREQDAEAQSA